jgi:trk system potassium uptake protein TrkH
MLPALIVSLIYGGGLGSPGGLGDGVAGLGSPDGLGGVGGLGGGEGDAPAFVLSILALAAVGGAMARVRPKTTNIYAKDGFAIVGFGWLLMSVLGAAPFLLSGAVPSPVDAVFESISGFSTTGASIIKNVEALPHGILFWRSFAHWIGGLGFLLLMLAILPTARANTVHIMKAESPGPAPEKFVPQIRRVAKILYGIYVALTFAEVIFLLCGGVPLFDALIHAFGTTSTGGFSNKNFSIGSFHSVYVENVVMAFMLLCGVNFTLYHALLRRNFSAFLHDEEFRFYALAILTASFLIAFNTFGQAFASFGEALRHGFFQVIAQITTTAYATADFSKWPTFSKCVMLFLMLCGASASSTGGGLKCVRVILLVKIARREVERLIHPRSVRAVKLNGKAVEEETLSGVVVFFFLYVATIVVATLLVSAEGRDIVSTWTAVLASISNNGTGLGMVSNMGSFADFSVASKIVLLVCMFVGRLEIYPVLLLSMPTFWRRVNI